MDNVICPHCEKEQSDCHNGGDPGPWWNGEDDSFDLECDHCDKPFILDTCWRPDFETRIPDEWDEIGKKPTSSTVETTPSAKE